jgi:hypothetical protein
VLAAGLDRGALAPGIDDGLAGELQPRSRTIASARFIEAFYLGSAAF